MKTFNKESPIIGIPRALFYWKDPFFWEDLFRNLGFKVLISPKTNKEIVEKGVKISDPETCFSVKILFGHLLFLDDKVDFIFIPRLKTNEKELEYCPKFFGMPDLAKIFIGKPILTFTLHEKKEKTEKTIEKFSKRLAKGKKTTFIKRALRKALEKKKAEEEKQEKEFLNKIKSNKKKIILISHPYNLHDEYVNIGMKRKIEDLGGEVIFIDQVPEKIIPGSAPKFHWEFGEEIMNKINTVLDFDIAGVIEISSFQCGCDAVLKEFVEKRFKERKVPFLYLMVDEQTGEAGIQTRLEAFWDTLH